MNSYNLLTCHRPEAQLINAADTVARDDLSEILSPSLLFQIEGLLLIADLTTTFQQPQQATEQSRVAHHPVLPSCDHILQLSLSFCKAEASIPPKKRLILVDPHCHHCAAEAVTATSLRDLLPVMGM